VDSAERWRIVRVTLKLTQGGDRLLTYDVGISDVQHDPPRRLDIIVAACDPREAMAAAEDRWRDMYNDEPPSALRGISWGY
jgi:hypothetical protein